MALTDNDKAWIAQLLDAKLDEKLDEKLSPIHKSIDTISGKLDVALLSVSRHVSDVDARAVHKVLRMETRSDAYRRGVSDALAVHLWPHRAQGDAA